MEYNVVLRWLVFICLLQVVKTDTGCGGKPADILFLLDCSSSIWKPNFYKQIRFVHSVVEEFDVSPTITRIGVITFGSSVTVEIQLGKYSSKVRLSTAINSIHQRTGDTRTDEALGQARAILERNGRDNIPHLVIVMTDGLSDFPELTKATATKLHRDGIFLFAIGIGKAADKNELNSIASEQDVVFKVDSFDALRRLKKMLAYKACNVHLSKLPVGRTEKPEISTRPQKGCGGKPADVVFALDSSSSIWGPDFNKQLHFVQDIIRVFDVGSNTTHIGVLSFGSQPRNHIQLNEFQKHEDIINAIENIKQSRGETNTASALRDIRRTFFSEKYSIRKNIVQVAIVITDGKSDNPKLTAHQAKMLRDEGVHVFAVGVGKAIELSELDAIASKPSIEYVNTVDNYDALDSIKELLAIKTCQVTAAATTVTITTTITTPEPMPADQGCGAQSPADVVFSLPPEAKAYETHQALTFIRNLIQEFDIANDKVRVGLVPRDCLAVPGLSLQSGHDKENILDMFEPLQYSAASVPNTLKYMRQESFRAERGAKKIGVIMIDSNSENRKATALEAMKAKKNSNIELFVVTIGKQVSVEESKIIASLPHASHVFTASSYADLSQLVESLKKSIDDLCNGL